MNIKETLTQKENKQDNIQDNIQDKTEVESLLEAYQSNSTLWCENVVMFYYLKSL
jgi:hypothetical protein